MTRYLLGAVVVLVTVCMALLVVNVRRSTRVVATPRATYSRHRTTSLDDRHILTSSASEGYIDRMVLATGQLDEHEMSAISLNTPLCESTP